MNQGQMWLKEDRQMVLDALKLGGVIEGKLDVYVEMLMRWQRMLNLVAPSTLPQVWSRHIADSAQVAAVLPDARKWVDLGSGGGFPGIVTGILLSQTAGAEVHLVESDTRKCAFLREVSRETSAPIHVHNMRIEKFIAAFDTNVDGVSARALARLSQLIKWSRPLLDRGAKGVFLKGEDVAAELTEIDADCSLNVTLVESRTLSSARAVLVERRRSLSGHEIGGHYGQ